MAAGEEVSDTIYVPLKTADGGIGAKAMSFSITSTDDAPVIAGDLSVFVAQGSSIVLTMDDLTAVDVDSEPDQLTFNIVDPVNGHIELGASTDTATSFTQQDLASGLVRFVHDGSDPQTASFAITVSDGVTSTPIATTVSLVVTTAIINILSSAGFSFQNEDFFATIGDGDTQSQLDHQIVVVNAAANRRFILDGDFTYDVDNIPHGAVTAVHASTNDALPLALYDIVGQIDATDIYNAAVAEAAGDFKAGENLTRNWSIRFVGDAGADAFESGDANDFFQGGGGNDILIGDAGLDRAGYRQATGPIQVTLGLIGDATAGTVIGTGPNSSGVGTDTLGSIEFITGTSYDDIFDATLFSETSQTPGASGTTNEFHGLGGNDQITGNGDTRVSYLNATGPVTVNIALGTATGDASVGTDSFTGVARVRGSNFADTLIGSDATTTEFFEGRGGNDSITGGGGTDVAVYNQSYSGSGIEVHLAAGTVAPRLPIGDADIGHDTLHSVEGILGTGYSDTYDAAGFSSSSTNAGSTSAINPTGTFNVFEGGGGNDAITGNFATRVQFTAATSGVTATLTTGGAGSATSSAALNLVLNLDPANIGTDTFTTGVLRLRGSDFGDTFNGNEQANLLEGQGGNDIMNGFAGTDTLTGGTGADRFA